MLAIAPFQAVSVATQSPTSSPSLTRLAWALVKPMFPRNMTRPTRLVAYASWP